MLFRERTLKKNIMFLVPLSENPKSFVFLILIRRLSVCSLEYSIYITFLLYESVQERLDTFRIKHW